MSSSKAGEVVGSRPNRQEQLAHEYWAPERRAAAKPVPVPKPGSGERRPKPRARLSLATCHPENGIPSEKEPRPRLPRAAILSRTPRHTLTARAANCSSLKGGRTSLARQPSSRRTSF